MIWMDGWSMDYTDPIYANLFSDQLLDPNMRFYKTICGSNFSQVKKNTLELEWNSTHIWGEGRGGNVILNARSFSDNLCHVYQRLNSGNEFCHFSGIFFFDTQKNESLLLMTLCETSLNQLWKLKSLKCQRIISKSVWHLLQKRDTSQKGICGRRRT